MSFPYALQCATTEYLHPATIIVPSLDYPDFINLSNTCSVPGIDRKEDRRAQNRSISALNTFFRVLFSYMPLSEALIEYLKNACSPDAGAVCVAACFHSEVYWPMATKITSAW